MGGAAGSARLLSLRLQGFKSFAARTVVEFGPGISAVVGPNGSGKSNLADALRWVLGEQGRALRSRKSEDVIFAGSERRAALGMAEATLSLDNADGLLPVEFRVLELGRRLFRSGENEYLLNRQKIRLRDLVDLLDGANLADNAFLFIGQGMVDQALSLRPEERRPLFEEVAGVRRHERRRRRAEEELTEAAANLERVEDILAELRPQAKRLAAMAEQQASRSVAASELVDAVLAVAHGRWHAAASRAAGSEGALEAARHAVDRALAGLGRAESGMSDVRARMAERAGEERDRRAALDAATKRVTAVRIRAAGGAAEASALARDEARAGGERDAARAEIAARRREIAIPIPPADADLDAAVRGADAALAEATDELAGLRAALARDEDARHAARRAAAAHAAELDTARRRRTATRAEADRAAAHARTARERSESLRAALDEAVAAGQAAGEAATLAAEAVAAGRAEVAAADDRVREAGDDHGAGSARAASVRARLEALERRRVDESERGIARAARRRGGRRIDEDLSVDPALRAAVEAALGERARGYVVPRAVVPALATERGILAVGESLAPAEAARGGGPLHDLATDPRAATLRRHLDTYGGGLLVNAIRHDPGGSARRLLALAAFVPDLDAALAVQPLLPPGAVVVVRDGSAVLDATTVHLGAADGTLERRAEEDALRVELERLAGEALAASRRLERARADLAAARLRLDEASRAERDGDAARRRADERERTLGRDAEAAAREAAWAAAQAARLEADAARAGSGFEQLAAFDDLEDATWEANGPDDPRAAARASWEARATELRRRRDELAAELGEQERLRRDAERRQAAAEAAVAMAEERAARAERDAATMAERRHRLETEQEALALELARLERLEGDARAAVDSLLASDATDRARLADAEADAIRERGLLRAAEEGSRAAEAAALQSRMELDLIREQALVELAALGDAGLQGLLRAAPAATGEPAHPTPTALDAEADPETAALEAALAGATERWAATPPPPDRPSTGRLAWLRRRYHELGAANPFAVEEYATVRERLDGLESQATDLRAAIDTTRALIADLNGLIADQFRSTFRALEIAFDARFQQLFGGGFARLTLTEPDDLSATGVEIVARPPGKKAQPLAMLSGGERALTAVALLFAMLEVRPVPFCVLDEVDAALDEANVGRFADALRGLAERTQFIVITHNRGTIEAADALYGVTAGEDSVSRVISLRLEEATELAARTTRAEPDLVAAH